ncbi:MAG: sigma-70 family RNA polymerase sigma factor [Labilithrix sp.]
MSIADELHLVRSGDRAAESALCARFIPAMRLFARRRLRTKDAVDEFVQDVLLVLVEAMRRGAIEDPERLGGFVLGICKNIARDRAKQRDRRKELWEKFGADLIQPDHDAPSMGGQDYMHLADCVSELSLRSRTLIHLSFYELKSHVEIASALEVSEANARVMRHRTLQALRDCMSKPLVWENPQ